MAHGTQAGERDVSVCEERIGHISRACAGSNAAYGFLEGNIFVGDGAAAAAAAAALLMLEIIRVM